MVRAIYFHTDTGPDPSIVKGLRAAKCDVVQTCSIVDTLEELMQAATACEPAVLVSDLDAGAMALLSILQEGRYGNTNANALHWAGAGSAQLPPTLVVDREGHDIATVVRAFHYGVCDYVLTNTPEGERELAARLLVERCNAQLVTQANTARPAPVDAKGLAFNPTVRVAQMGRAALPSVTEMASVRRLFEWDANKNVIRCAGASIAVSPTEGRIFNRLAIGQGTVVSIHDLAGAALLDPGDDADLYSGRIRAHVMKLRRKLDAVPSMSDCIVSVRGTGYMLL